MSETLIISILAASITAGTPILFAALGELIAERSGIMNLGVDGMMLVGAVTGFMITVNTGILGSGLVWPWQQVACLHSFTPTLLLP